MGGTAFQTPGDGSTKNPQAENELLRQQAVGESWDMRIEPILLVTLVPQTLATSLHELIVSYQTHPQVLSKFQTPFLTDKMLGLELGVTLG